MNFGFGTSDGTTPIFDICKICICVICINKHEINDRLKMFLVDEIVRSIQSTKFQNTEKTRIKM